MRMLIAGALMLLSTSAHAQWEKTEEASPLDDSRTVRIMRWSDEPFVSRYRRTPLAMVIQCQKGEFAILFYFGGEFLRSDTISVDYRIDKQPAQKKLFAVTSNREWAITSVGLASTVSALTLFDELASGRSIYVQITGALGEVVHGRFTLNGLTDAVRPVQNACRSQRRDVSKSK